MDTLHEAALIYKSLCAPSRGTLTVYLRVGINRPILPGDFIFTPYQETASAINIFSWPITTLVSRWDSWILWTPSCLSIPLFLYKKINLLVCAGRNKAMATTHKRILRVFFCLLQVTKYWKYEGTKEGTI